MAGPERLSARAGREPAAKPFDPGPHRLGLSAARDAVLYVPKTLRQPAPLVVLLHGAGGTADNILPLLAGPAESQGFLVLVPQSRGRTWDLLLDGYGADARALDAALTEVFRREDVDACKVAMSGFSDGASYALSLGLPNGDLFGHILAFSPGFTAARSGPGRPAIFISHGRDDAVLPIEPCSRRIVGLLRAAGYALDYREFEGGHVVPPEMVGAALAQLLEPDAQGAAEPG